MTDPESRPADVVCIGSAIVDVLTHTDDAFLATHGMTKGSMQLVDTEGATAIYADMAQAIEISGGSAANTAAGIASFGGSVAFVGKVADDQLGEVFTHDIRAAGVSFLPSAGSGDLETARCLILVTPDAQRTMNTYLGMASQIGPDDIDEALVASAKIVYCEGYLWDLPEAKAALIKAMDIAHSAGKQVAFTLSDSFCVDRHRDEFLELVAQHVDILFANETEIMSLYEAPSWEVAIAQVSEHCDIACLTRSEKGSVVLHAHDQIAIPAVAVDAVVDTTGAGDLYAAGFLYGYTNGLDLETSGRLASLAASEVIAHVGARSEVPLDELAREAGILA